MTMKCRMAKLKVYSVSGPAWQPVKNGKPYNRWVGTIQFTDPLKVMFGFRYFLIVSSRNKDLVAEKLDKFIIGEIVNVPKNNLILPNFGGKNEIQTSR